MIINTGVPESDLQDAEPDFRGMNLVGYDAMAIGNHEFDNPLSVLRQQEKWAKFPLLSANIYQKGTQQRLFKPYALFDKQGIKIAVLGLTTDDTPKVSSPENVVDIEFRVPAVEAKHVVEQLRKTENQTSLLLPHIWDITMMVNTDPTPQVMWKWRVAYRLAIWI